MMSASGVLFLSQTKPLATWSRDGTFALTLLAFDRIGAHQVEPWRITWSGPVAQAFHSNCADHLKPGQPIQVRVHQMRNFTNGRHGAEFTVQALSIELAPMAPKRGCSQPAVCVGSC